MDTSFNEMAVDNLSFYDDGESTMLMQHSIQQQQQQQQHFFSPSPPLASLLSPEGSPQRFRIVNKQTPPKLNLNQNIEGLQNVELAGKYANFAGHQKAHTPKTMRTFNSLSSESMDTSMDDDYMDFFEIESLESNQNEGLFSFPTDLNSLICGQIKNESPEKKLNRRLFLNDDETQMNNLKTPETQRRPSVRRCLSLFEEETTPIRTKIPEEVKKTPTTALNLSINQNVPSPTTCAFKRPEAPTNFSPRQAKRYRFSEKEKENFSGSLLSDSPTFKTISELNCQNQLNSKPILRKSMSMNDAEIMTALARSDNSDEPQLIGDFSGPFVLPLIEGRHRDLKSISSDTLARLIKGDYVDKVASYQIIDCRYPYEFDGGHIRGARNLYTQEQIIAEFLSKQKTDKNEANKEAAGKKRNIIIFHCEFSSERGPKLSRFLRNNDRARNTSSYPALDYPEIYLLHNGYKEFYETHSDLCDPASYRPMLEPSYNEAYRHFRAKSKSWNGGDGFGTVSSRKKLYSEGRSLLYRL